MKLYTKKMTYSLLATGLLACAPVDAYWSVKEKHCKTMCEGHFVQEAKNKGLTGEIKAVDMSEEVKGKGKNRQCICTYTGDLDIKKKKTFNQRDARRDKVLKNLRKVQNRAARLFCNKKKEICIKYKKLF